MTKANCATSDHAALWPPRRAIAMVFVLGAMVNLLMLTGSIYMLQVYDRVLASRSIETLLGLFGIVVHSSSFSESRCVPGWSSWPDQKRQDSNAG